MFAHRHNVGSSKSSYQTEWYIGYCQQELELLLQRWAKHYRAPVMVLRCVDYENWAAAAVLCQVHGELG